MLVLTRKKGETIMIGDHIELTVVGVEGDTVKIGIRAPRNVEIHRQEVYLAIQQSNREARGSFIDMKELQEFPRKEK
jgi:carbon storage regulator